MKIYWLIFLFITVGSNAQGLLFDDEVYGKIPRQSTYGDGGKSEEKALRGISKVDLKPYCPQVKHQGEISSCVGWSVGYAAYSIQQAILNNWKGQKDLITQKAFSAMFIYNQIKITDCTFGARISDALKLLQEVGDVHAWEFDKNIRDCSTIPSKDILEKANGHRIKDFMTLFSPEAESTIKITKTKLSLAQNKPVVIGMNLLNNFVNIRHGSQYWIPQIGNTNVFGGHAMCVVGFDDGKGAFEVMNSWGSLWGNDGFIWIKYEDFTKYCKYAYQFSTNEGIKQEKIYTGRFELKRPVIRTRDTIIFNTEPVQFNGQFYQLANKNVDPGSKFQFWIKEINQGMYLYAFSLAPTGEINIHWPRDEQLDEKFEGLHESALVTVPEVKLIMPGRHSALQFNNQGKDYVVLLYSTGAINDFNQKLSQIMASPGNLVERIRATFGEQLVPLKDIRYNPSAMQFNNPIQSGSVIPLILEVDISNS